MPTLQKFPSYFFSLWKTVRNFELKIVAICLQQNVKRKLLWKYDRELSDFLNLVIILGVEQN